MLPLGSDDAVHGVRKEISSPRKILQICLITAESRFKGQLLLRQQTGYE